MATENSASRVWLFSTGRLVALEAMLDRSGSVRRSDLSLTCALVELGDRLVLIDVGFGRRTARSAIDYPGIRFCLTAPVVVRHEETAAARIEALGRRTDEVTDVILTHLHLDHTGGLEDFPKARVHVTADAYARAHARPWPLPDLGYDRRAFVHGPRWSIFATDRDEALGFSRTRDLFGDGSVRVLDAPGHSRGHIAVAVRVGDRTLIHAGDAYFRDAELDFPDAPRSVLGPGLRLQRWVVVEDAEQERRTIEQLARLRGRDDVVVVNSHDPLYLRRHAAFPEPALRA